jgi:hypothetical protein
MTAALVPKFEGAPMELNVGQRSFNARWQNVRTILTQ